MITDPHYSAFTLDVHWASAGPKDPAIEAHVRDCLACRAHIEELDSLASVCPPVWPKAARAPSAGPRVRSRWARAALPALAAVALGGALFLAQTRDGAQQYVGLKGTPAVQVLVSAEGRTRIWDGRMPVRPGDVLALRVACEGLSHVVVSSPAARVYAGTCPAEPGVLPFTLIPDDEPGDEQVNVVLSRRPLDPRALAGAIATEMRSEDVWVVRLTLAKRARP
jgi:hypothetical protein